MIPTMLAVPALAACSFSMSAGGLDYSKLESAITDELNSSYSDLPVKVSSVDCPRQSESPKAGDTFVCKADVDGSTVRVQVNVKDDDKNVDYSTLDVLFDLPQTASGLESDISEDRGFDVTVDCGEGIKVVEIGQTFECTAADPQGATRTVKVTAGGVGQKDRWEIVDPNGG